MTLVVMQVIYSVIEMIFMAIKTTRFVMQITPIVITTTYLAASIILIVIDLRIL